MKRLIPLPRWPGHAQLAVGLALACAACGRVGYDPGDGPIAVPGASSFSDDFASGSFAPNWFPVDESCVHEAGGELVAQPAPNTVDSYCFAWTTSSYRLASDSVAVKVPEVTTQATIGVQTFIYLETADGSQELVLLLEGGGFQLYGTGPTLVVTGGYDPQEDLWWRLREAGGDLFFETSPDGTTFVLRGQWPDPIVLDDVRVGLGAGAWQALASPGQARFDCYNLPAPCP